MMYANYAWRTILQLLFTLLAFILAPLLAVSCSSQGWLPYWLLWFQTEDASIDAGWTAQYAGYSKPDGTWWTRENPPPALTLYWFRLKWLWRNPAYGFCYWPLGLAYDPSQWTITLCVVNPDKSLAEFEARTKDGKYFSYINDRGVKLGYKLWWALDEFNQLVPRMGANRGPDNRLPICFTPF